MAIFFLFFWDWGVARSPEQHQAVSIYLSINQDLISPESTLQSRYHHDSLGFHCEKTSYHGALRWSSKFLSILTNHQMLFIFNEVITRYIPRRRWVLWRGHVTEIMPYIHILFHPKLLLVLFSWLEQRYAMWLGRDFELRNVLSTRIRTVFP